MPVVSAPSRLPLPVAIAASGVSNHSNSSNVTSVPGPEGHRDFDGSAASASHLNVHSGAKHAEDSDVSSDAADTLLADIADAPQDAPLSRDDSSDVADSLLADAAGTFMSADVSDACRAAPLSRDDSSDVGDALLAGVHEDLHAAPTADDDNSESEDIADALLADISDAPQARRISHQTTPDPREAHCLSRPTSDDDASDAADALLADLPPLHNGHDAAESHLASAASTPPKLHQALPRGGTVVNPHRQLQRDSGFEPDEKSHVEVASSRGTEKLTGKASTSKKEWRNRMYPDDISRPRAHPGTNGAGSRGAAFRTKGAPRQAAADKAYLPLPGARPVALTSPLSVGMCRELPSVDEVLRPIPHLSPQLA